MEILQKGRRRAFFFYLSESAEGRRKDFCAGGRAAFRLPCGGSGDLVGGSWVKEKRLASCKALSVVSLARPMVYPLPQLVRLYHGYFVQGVFLRGHIIGVSIAGQGFATFHA